MTKNMVFLAYFDAFLARKIFMRGVEEIVIERFLPLALCGKTRFWKNSRRENHVFTWGKTIF